VFAPVGGIAYVGGEVLRSDRFVPIGSSTNSHVDEALLQ